MTSTDAPIARTGATGAGPHREAAANGGGSPSPPGEPWWPVLPRWVLPVLIAAVQVGGSVRATLPGTWVEPRYPELGLVLLLVGPLALLGRQRHPLMALIVALAAADAYLLLGYPRGPYFVAAAVALGVAASRARRAAVWTIATLFFLTVVVALWASGSFPPGSMVVGLYINNVPVAGTGYGDAAFAFVWISVALAIGEVVRAQRERSAASARARAESERARAEAERARAEAERAQVSLPARRRVRPHRTSPPWTTSSPRRRRPARRSTLSGRARRGRCPARWSGRRTGSCGRR